MSNRLLPYDTIIKAHEGDPIAIQAVLDRYAGYIRYFSNMNGSRKAPGGGGMDQQRAEDRRRLGRVHRHAAALCQRLHPTISLIGQIELADNSVHGLAEKSNRRFTPSCGAATGAR